MKEEVLIRYKVSDNIEEKHKLNYRLTQAFRQ